MVDISKITDEYTIIDLPEDEIQKISNAINDNIADSVTFVETANNDFNTIYKSVSCTIALMQDKNINFTHWLTQLSSESMRNTLRYSHRYKFKCDKSISIQWRWRDKTNKFIDFFIIKRIHRELV